MTRSSVTISRHGEVVGLAGRRPRSAPRRRAPRGGVRARERQVVVVEAAAVAAAVTVAVEGGAGHHDDVDVAGVHQLARLRRLRDVPRARARGPTAGSSTRKASIVRGPTMRGRHTTLPASSAQAMSGPVSISVRNVAKTITVRAAVELRKLAGARADRPRSGARAPRPHGVPGGEGGAPQRLLGLPGAGRRGTRGARTCARPRKCSQDWQRQAPWADVSRAGRVRVLL